MNAWFKLILIIASFQSLFTLSMEQTETAHSSTDLTTEHKEALTRLYSLTQFVLSNSESLGYIHSSFSEKPTHNLLSIIATTNELKKNRITEERIARLAYKKEPYLFDQDQSLLEKFEQLVSDNHKASNYHIAVFFKRLEHYNNQLVKNEFITPTFEQYKNYLDNKNIETSFKKAIKKSESFGLLLDETMIQRNQAPFIDIPMNIATEELDKLISDIKTMCDKNIPLIQSVAELLYLNNKDKNHDQSTTENQKQ